MPLGRVRLRSLVTPIRRRGPSQRTINAKLQGLLSCLEDYESSELFCAAIANRTKELVRELIRFSERGSGTRFNTYRSSAIYAKYVMGGYKDLFYVGVPDLARKYRELYKYVDIAEGVFMNIIDMIRQGDEILGTPEGVREDEMEDVSNPIQARMEWNQEEHGVTNQ